MTSTVVGRAARSRSRKACAFDQVDQVPGAAAAARRAAAAWLATALLQFVGGGAAVGQQLPQVAATAITATAASAQIPECATGRA